MNFVAAGEEVLLERGDFQVRLANTQTCREKCSELVNAMYSWRGYRMQREDEQARADRLTLQACRGEDLLGTLTLCCDSPSGLPADRLYREQIDFFRRQGAKVCELTRFAVDPIHGSKEVLSALFYHAYVFSGPVRGMTDVFIEVHPRHATFYERFLKFAQIGEQKICERVNAPATLLHVAVAAFARHIAECRERLARARQSRNPYFFDRARGPTVPSHAAHVH